MMRINDENKERLQDLKTLKGLKSLDDVITYLLDHPKDQKVDGRNFGWCINCGYYLGMKREKDFDLFFKEGGCPDCGAPLTSIKAQGIQLSTVFQHNDIWFRMMDNMLKYTRKT